MVTVVLVLAPAAATVRSSTVRSSAVSSSLLSSSTVGGRRSTRVTPYTSVGSTTEAGMREGEGTTIKGLVLDDDLYNGLFSTILRWQGREALTRHRGREKETGGDQSDGGGVLHD